MQRTHAQCGGSGGCSGVWWGAVDWAGNLNCRQGWAAAIPWPCASKGASTCSDLCIIHL
jgi:hypothetical protein